MYEKEEKRQISRYHEFVMFAPDELISVITTVFKRILDVGEVPDDWAPFVYQPIETGENGPTNTWYLAPVVSVSFFHQY